MNEYLPYEQQLALKWKDLPLPDENMAWADMKRRLEEEEDDQVIPFWLRGCVLWGLLGVFILGFGWWIVRPEKWITKKQNAGTVQTTDRKEEEKNKVNGNKGSTKVNSNDSNVIDKQKGITVTPPDTLQRIDRSPEKKNNQQQSELIKTGADIKTTSKTEKQKQKNSGEFVNVFVKKQKNQSITKIRKNKSSNILKTGKDQDKKISGDSAIDQNRRDVVKIIPEKKAETVNKPDSVSKSGRDSSQKKNNIDQIVQTKTSKQDGSKRKNISFAAGLSLQQQLPINGQKLVSYNSLGRKGTLADYIPSLYLRMYKGDKWFLQSEFRYGAPQYTKEFLYKQNIVADTQNLRTTITSNRLKKTFYHQLPLMFNYFILPNWSAGGGIAWNKFTSAVSERDVILHNNPTGTDSVISKGVLTSSKQADSNFAKSYFQGVFETQYKWKRFSFGARYSFGLQPYIKFTLPGGLQQAEKNSSLQIFARYELWRSKKE